MPREQLVLIPTALEQVIPADHPVRLVDEILDQLVRNSPLAPKPEIQRTA